MKVALIEDDPLLGGSLREYLENCGCEVDWFQDEREIEDVETLGAYDVVVLDLILKYRSGEEILRDMRERGVDVPVLVLTAKTSITDKETCFNLGADDYLTKPFEPRELVLRLRSLVRRVIGEIVRVGDAEIDLKGRVVRRGGKEFKLSKTAWELLMLLLRNRGKVVKTETILSCVWGDKPVGSDVVRAYIKEIRKVLPESSIETHKGVGYRLV
ncbi:MAG: response regulator transcription factor [Aquificota bacterium]|nr:response regulator transcription factor [Aquificota bacterium]